MPHTPGPWEYTLTDSMEDDEDAFVVQNPDVSDIAEITSPADSAEDNARLIAAAPDLLTACEEIVRMLGKDCSAYKAGELARAAIAKATTPTPKGA